MFRPRPSRRHARLADDGRSPLGWIARIRAFDDWRQVMTLRVLVPVILAAVSAYYLTRWAHSNAMPWALAWTLPAALDVTAFMAVTVGRRAVDRGARRKAAALTWLCVVLSVAGNIGSHALDFTTPGGGPPLLTVSIWTIAATSMVYPLMLIAGHIVAGGMRDRPMARQQIDLHAAQLAALGAATRATARATRAEQALAEVSTRRRPPARQAPARQAAPAAPPAPAPAAGDAPTLVSASTPAQAPASAPAGAPAFDDLLTRSVDYMRANPEHGRRLLLKHLQKTHPQLTDHKVKPLHKTALEVIERREVA